MAYIATTKSNALRANEIFAHVATSLRNALARRKLFLQTRNELNSLSDRDLADLGIGRGEINAIARLATKIA